MQKKINLYPKREAFGLNEVNALREVISYYRKKKEDPPYKGKFELRLSEAFSKYMNGGYTLPVSSGTAAAFVAIQSIKLKKKSEILITPINDSGPINSIITLGLKPKLCDTRENSYNVDLNSIKNSLSKKTKAVLISHIAGEASQIYKIKKFLKKKKIFLIEDCSQAPGAKCFSCTKRCMPCKKKKVGEFGDISYFSTMYRKNIASAGSGGLIYTKSLNLFRNIQSFADRGKQPWKKLSQNDPSLAKFPALNYNTNEFSCAITNSSLKRLNYINRMRNYSLKYFIKELKKFSKVCLPYNHHNDFAPFFFPIFVDEKKITISKNEFAKELIIAGIPVLPEYNCIVPKWKWAKKYFSNFKAPNAMELSKKSFNLFLNEKFSKIEMKEIVRRICLTECKFLK
jgi:dTDP-4-amino-4,6-dideoxygalactose transaminase